MSQESLAANLDEFVQNHHVTVEAAFAKPGMVEGQRSRMENKVSFAQNAVLISIAVQRPSA
jgi:hypothetical protein